MTMIKAIFCSALLISQQLHFFICLCVADNCVKCHIQDGVAVVRFDTPDSKVSPKYGKKKYYKKTSEISLYSIEDVASLI